MKFCDNPLCEHHVPIDYPTQIDKLFYEGGSNNKISISRHKYQRGGVGTFYFCDICHSAMSMFSGALMDENNSTKQ